MSHFIIIFDRRRRSDTDIVRIDDPGEAVARLFEIENELRDDRTGRDVVMPVAEDEDSIRATHSHYFKSFDELVDLAEA